MTVESIVEGAPSVSVGAGNGVSVEAAVGGGGAVVAGGTGVADGAVVLVGGSVMVGGGTVGTGELVEVGGSVSVGRGLGVYVRVGIRVAVLGGSGSDGRRVRVGGIRVRVGVNVVVTVLVGVSVWVKVLVGDGEIVAVGIYSATDSRVNADIVLIFEMAESIRSCGSMARGVLDTLGPEIAAADTIQNRLKPTTPDASTVSGPRYSLIFTPEYSYD